MNISPFYIASFPTCCPHLLSLFASCLFNSTPPSPNTHLSPFRTLIYPSSSALPLPSLCTVINFSPSVSLSIFALSYFLSPSLSPTCGFALHPSVLLPSLPPFSSYPSLTYGFPLWFFVCLVLPRVHWGSLHVCVCLRDRDRETQSMYVCRLMDLPAWPCFCKCVCER